MRDELKQVHKDLEAGETIGQASFLSIVKMASDPKNIGAIGTVASSMATSVLATVYLAIATELGDQAAGEWLSLVAIDFEAYLSNVGKKVKITITRVDE